MSKPDDITQEVWDEAKGVNDNLWALTDTDERYEQDTEVIARAIMAAIAQEREECAKVADNLASKYDKVASTPRVGTIDTDLDRLWAIEEALKTASEAIRSRP